MKNIAIKTCPYCNATELCNGYQSGNSRATVNRNGTKGARIVHIICRECGSIVYSKVEETSIFNSYDPDAPSLPYEDD